MGPRTAGAGTKQVGEMSPAERSANARGLGLSVWGITSLCYLACNAFYAALHWVYKRDMARPAGDLVPGEEEERGGGGRTEESRALLVEHAAKARP